MVNIKRLHVCDQPHKWYEQLYTKHYPGSPHNSKHMFDIYALTHVFWTAVLSLVVGIIFGLNSYTIAGIVLYTMYFEYHENKIEQIIMYRRIEVDSSGHTTYRGDSTINIVGDIIGNILGLMLVLYTTTQNTLITLFVLFLYITSVVGIGYWTEFIEFGLFG
jgi:hypothetical protein